MYHDDGSIRELHPWVHLRKSRVAPARDFSEVNVCQDLAGELHAVADSRDVVRGHDRAEHGWHMKHLALHCRQLLVRHRSVAGAEINGSGSDLTDTATAADGLIVELNVRMLIVIFAEPLG